MSIVKLTYEGKDYEARAIRDFDDSESTLLVAPESLLYDMGNMSSEEAKNLDNQIAFYASHDDMQRTDKELFEHIYGPVTTPVIRTVDLEPAA